ncbi:MAG TPA: hypothetical protein VNV15_08780 [Opitutaceae bacterium]|jgi:hypothetical protein|nr:hypothetical protein [Opitutaceae bacterium]
MNAPVDISRIPPARAFALAGAGLALAVVAWMLPVNLKSVTPALLQAAGAGTPSLVEYGRQLTESEKIGPAALVLAAAQTVGDARAPELADDLAKLSARQPEFVAWGGWDPFLDPIFKLRENTGRSQSTPVLAFLITEKARTSLRDYLAGTRSLGVEDLLGTRDIPTATRFVPVGQPGGQALDSVILLTALLYQGEHLSPSLQRELRGLAEAALAKKDFGEMELFYLDLLSLGKRLDWGQLSELLSRTDSTKTVGEYAHLARVAPGQLPLIYSTALFSDSADSVASYLIQYGESGAADLRLALGAGQGAVRQLLLRQVPVNHSAGPALGDTATLALLYPKLTLAVKWLGFFAGAFLLFRGLDCWLFAMGGGVGNKAMLLHLRSGVLALFAAILLVVATEPFLLKATPLSAYRLKIVIPMLANVATPSSQPQSSTHPDMDTSTLISIGVFALLQVATYLVCLMKIGEIERQDLSPQLKLRLMENEENLFDSGLYIGMMGTATALVLQVVGVIPANLLAAYSSNLFGIVCVALVKIRHVRGYKRQLIFDSQPAPVPAASVLPAKA